MRKREQLKKMGKKAEDQEKPLIFQVRDPIYLVDIHYIFGSAQSRIDYVNKTFEVEYVAMHSEEHVQGSTSAFAHDLPHMRGHYIIWVKDRKDSYTLIHECFHAVIMVLGDSGVHLQADDSDAGAYYMEFLVRSATQGLLESLKKKEPKKCQKKLKSTSSQDTRLPTA